ncbi:acetoacetate decarboxylase family protein, partial [Bacillus sp. S34]|nr:acetoacetate decarboxylase family protein [Bacillus sp. S34]
TAPVYPPRPTRFTAREYLNVVYRTDPDALRAVVPEPLQIDEPLVRFEVMNMAEVDGYGVAMLLWSDENVWEHGEVDFPEGALGAPAYLNVHCLEDPAEKCVHYETSASLADWHTYTIEWTPSRMSFLIDGEVVADQQHAEPEVLLQVGQQVEHGTVLRVLGGADPAVDAADIDSTDTSADPQR